ncbi:BACON domain-containing carbohydrate-binding protein [Termitidicoccus mucosus]|uniref:BACON domain-containing protein n=1 Tax=Termitidicoccus mucosus TaxID=1184151 RepID=A0A178INR3_9BACT|nr:hypothetical protein AW736_02800 [Opitutaceae bacterium TSB47]
MKTHTTPAKPIAFAFLAALLLPVAAPAPAAAQTTGPALIVSATAGLSLGAAAGTANFGIRNGGSGELPWSAAVTGSGSEWLIFTDATPVIPEVGGVVSGTNWQTIRLSYEANPGAARTASVQITAAGATGSPATVTVTQAAASAPPVLSVVLNTRLPDHGAYTIGYVVANLGGGTLEWTAEQLSGGWWAHDLQPYTSGSASGINYNRLRVSFDENPTGLERTAQIRFTAPGATGSPAIMTITQPGIPVFSVTPYERYTPGTSSGTATFAVANLGGGSIVWSATIAGCYDYETDSWSDTCPWARITSGSAGVNNGAVTLAYDANPEGGGRRYTSIHIATETSSYNYVHLEQAANLSGGSAGPADPVPDLIHFPSGLVRAPDGALYAASVAGNSIHKILPGTGTAAGTAYALAGDYGAAPGHADTTGAAARFHRPFGVALAGGGLIVADTGNNVIRRVDLATRAVTTLAGAVGQTGTANGPGAAARFEDIAYVSANASGDTVYVADNHSGSYDDNSAYGIIRKLTLTGTGAATAATVSTLATLDGGAAYDSGIYGLAVSAGTGDIYALESRWGALADYGVVRKITPAGVVTTLSGMFNFYPADLAVDDAAQLLYVSTEEPTAAIYARSLTGTGGFALVAGSATEPGFEDGPALTARFGNELPGPNLAVNAATGDLFIADFNNNAIRKLTASGTVTTLWLTATTAPATDGGTGDGGNNPGNGNTGGGGGAMSLWFVAALFVLPAIRHLRRRLP